MRKERERRGRCVDAGAQGETLTRADCLVQVEYSSWLHHDHRHLRHLGMVFTGAVQSASISSKASLVLLCKGAMDPDDNGVMFQGHTTIRFPVHFKALGGVWVEKLCSTLRTGMKLAW